MVPDPPLPLQFGPGFGGPPLFFRLFGLLFAATGALDLLRPREMAAWQFRRRHGEIEGTLEPIDTRVLMMRVLGGFFVLLGPGIFLGLLP